MDDLLGFDVGTSSSKGVLVSHSGHILTTAKRAHQVSRPEPGRVEMDPEIWWEEFCQVAVELRSRSMAGVAAVGVSGMGPSVALVDASNRPTTPTKSHKPHRASNGAFAHHDQFQNARIEDTWVSR